MPKTFRIGLFTSAWDEAAWRLVEAIRQAVDSGFIPHAAISFVLCSRELGETHFGDLMITNVTKSALPLITFSSRKFQTDQREAGRKAAHEGDLSLINRWRMEHDAEIDRMLSAVDLNVLVGWMWVLADLQKTRTIINLHPALPDGPKGTYREVIEALVHSRALETGIMVHLVTDELDRGPTVAFCRFPIRGPLFDPYWLAMERQFETKLSCTNGSATEPHARLLAVIRQEGVIREMPLLVRTIKSVAEGSLRIENDSVFCAADQPLVQGYDLTEPVEAAVQQVLRRSNVNEFGKH